MSSQMMVINFFQPISELIQDLAYRQKTIAAEKMKLGIKDLIDELQKEEKCIKDYQTELELLIQEKMAHVEELRLIHTDINTVRCTSVVVYKHNHHTGFRYVLYVCEFWFS